MSDINPGSKEPKRKTTIIIVNSLLAIAVVLSIIWGITTYFNLDKDAYTNDAQVEEYISPINVRIPGYIKSVRFEEHQKIQKGDTLVQIEDNEYQIAVEQAEAAYLSAIAGRSVAQSARNTVGSNLGTSDANIAASKARLWNAEQNLHRYEHLLNDGAATQQQFDQIKTDYDALKAQTKALERQHSTAGLSLDEATKRLDVNEAEIKRAHAALALAKVNLSYTNITAPFNGYTGRRNIQEGQLVQAGQNLLSLARNNEKWIVANYRETQLPYLHIGDSVELIVDGISGRKLKGHILAISAATGSRYSAVPVDNATGNFVKVQQRIPVKISLDKSNPSGDLDLLRAGMNVEVRLKR
jgi:membrane fusion protein (multidrug efflux system)